MAPEILVFSGVEFPAEMAQSELGNADLLQIRNLNGRAEIDGRTFSRVVVHIGDATALAALTSLQESDTAVLIVDPIARAAAHIISELQSNPAQLGTAIDTDETLRNTLLSFQRSMHSGQAERIRREYSRLWTQASPSVNNLFVVEAGIDEFKVPSAFVDEVTYHYPFREDTLETSFIFAMNALHLGGKFTLVTEMTKEEQVDVYTRHNFIYLLAQLAQASGNSIEYHEVQRVRGQGPYHSGYDMSFETKYPTETPTIVTIIRGQGPAPEWMDEATSNLHKTIRNKRRKAEEL